ncbi:MAG: ATP-dependent dethiobiotin synthetase BioD [Sphingomonadales bacterium]|nr:ATP-dependent dethiobiotin synthetase BioD [Sphingomonadales bacterium]
MRGLVVTGTDTGIGKSVVAAGLTAALGARYWKPVQAGLDGATDSATVAALAPGAPIHPEAYRLATPASPHHAAAIDGVRIAESALALPEGAGPLVVEGAGGVLVPLREDWLYADQMARWGLPVVLVARTALGTINHGLLSIEALRARGVAIAGLVFVGEPAPESERVIGAIAQVARLGRLPWLDPLDAASLRRAIAAHLDLGALA